MRFLRALSRALVETGWVLGAPVIPYDVGPVRPPREPDVDRPTVPLTAYERRTFQRLVSAHWD